MSCGTRIGPKAAFATLASYVHKAMGWTPPPSRRHRCAKVEVSDDHLTRMGASAMNVTAVGIDLAKNVFQVHAVDARGKVVLRKQPFGTNEGGASSASLPQVHLPQ